MFLHSLPLDLKIEISNKLEDDRDRMNMYHLNSQHRNVHKKHISAMILKRYLKFHDFETVDDLAYIAGLYPPMDLLKYLQHMFDTPDNSYVYNPLTHVVHKKRNHKLFKNLNVMKVISHKSKLLDGLLDLF